MAVRLWLAVDRLNLGEGVEEGPLSLAWHGTWHGTRNRFSEILDNVCITAAGVWRELCVLTELPDLVNHRRDDRMLHLELFSKTRTSGIPEIDAVQAKSVQLDLSSGEGFVGLEELFLAAQAGKDGVYVPLSSTMAETGARSNALVTLSNGNNQIFTDPASVLGKERARQLDEQVFNAGLKGELRLRAEVLDEQAVATFSKDMLAVVQGNDPNHLLYGTPAMLTAAAKSFERLEFVYMERMTGLPDPKIDERYRFLHDPNEALLENLHMYKFDAATGPLCSIAMVLQDPLDRGLDAEVSHTDPFFHAFADEMDVLLHATALRNGLSVDQWCTIVEKQFERTDDVVHADFLTAVAVVCQLGTFPANQINYESDQSVPNTQWLEKQTPETQRLLAPQLFAETKKRPETEASFAGASVVAIEKAVNDLRSASLRQLRQERTGGVNVPMATAASGRMLALTERLKFNVKMGQFSVTSNITGVSRKGVVYAIKSMFLGEKWDFCPGAGVKNSGDCEDSTVYAVVTHHAMLRESRRNPEFGKRRSLRCLSAVMELYHPHFNGSAVSEAYVKTDGSNNGNNNNKPAAPPVRHEPPLIGSREDVVETKQAGHAHGTYEPEPVVSTRMLRGIETGTLHVDDRALVEQTLKQRIDRCPPWAWHAPSFVLEGTGTIREIVTSFEGAYRGMERADVHVRKGAAILHAARALKSRATPEHATLADFARIQAQPTELWMQEPNRRTSTFYRSIGHVLAPRLYHEVAPTLGHLTPVRISTRRRGINIGDYLNGSHPDVALVSVYGHRISVAEWQRDHEPYMRAQLNQQPLFAALHRDMPRKQAQGQPLLNTDLMSLATFERGVGLEKLSTCLNQCGLQVALANYNSNRNAALSAGSGVVPYEEGDSSSSSHPTVEINNLELLLASHGRDDLAVLPLSIPAWKMPAMGHQKTAALLTALETMRTRGDIRGYVFERAKPMLRCGDTIQLLLTLPVAEQVDLGEFPHHQATCIDPPPTQIAVDGRLMSFTPMQQVADPDFDLDGYHNMLDGLTQRVADPDFGPDDYRSMLDGFKAQSNPTLLSMVAVSLNGYFTNPLGRPYEEDVTEILTRIVASRLTPASVKSLLRRPYDNTTVRRLTKKLKRMERNYDHAANKSERKRRHRARKEDDAAELLFDKTDATDTTELNEMRQCIAILHRVLADLFKAEVVRPLERLLQVGGALSGRTRMWIGNYPDARGTLEPNDLQRARTHLRSLHDALAQMAEEMADAGMDLWNLYWDRLTEAIMELMNLAGGGNNNQQQPQQQERFVHISGDVFDPREPSLTQNERGHFKLLTAGRDDRHKAIDKAVERASETTTAKTIRSYVRFYPRCVAALFEYNLEETGARTLLAEYGTMLGGQRAPLDFAPFPSSDSFTMKRIHVADDAVQDAALQTGQWI